MLTVLLVNTSTVAVACEYVKRQKHLIPVSRVFFHISRSAFFAWLFFLVVFQAISRDPHSPILASFLSFMLVRFTTVTLISFCCDALFHWGKYFAAHVMHDRGRKRRAMLERDVHTCSLEKVAKMVERCLA